MTITATRDGQHLPVPAVEETTTVQAAASVNYLTGNQPTKGEAVSLINQVIPDLWGNPDKNDRESQARRILSALLHKDVEQSVVADILEAYDKLHHMEFGGDLQSIYGDTRDFREYRIRSEQEVIEDAINNMTYGIRP